ncbi:MAG: Lrp/AsnC family transcriptional regulator [Pseudomonadota bacterium]
MEKAASFDPLNQSIVDILQHDGRTSFAEIASALGVSEGTIRNRVNSMKAAGALRIVAIADPGEVEYATDAMLGVTVASSSTPRQVSERLAPFSEVVFILWVSGRYDLLIEIVSGQEGEFLQFLDAHIYGQPDIATVEVMSGLNNFKNQFLLKNNWS